MTYVTTLDGGLRVVTAEMPDRQSVSVGVWLRCGSRDESARLNGISHFIEHYVFKGTRRRTGEQITREIEGVGGSLDASTGEESTFYYAHVLPEHLECAVDTLMDMVVSPTFPADQLDVQKDIVLEEIRMVEDRPSSLVEDLFSEALWGTHPLGRRVLGTVGTIERMTRADLVGYQKRMYTRAGCVVALAGNVRHDAAVKLVGRGARRMPGPPTARFRRVVERQRRPVVKVFARETEEGHVVLGVRTFRRGHPARFALRIISTILGENMSSRLFENVREKRGLAYSIYSGIDRYMDTGCLYVGGGLDTARLTVGLRAIVHEFDRLRRHRIGRAELERAKQYAVGQLTMGLEKSMSRVVWIGENLLLSGCVPDPAETIRRLRAITADDVQRVARLVFRPGRTALAYIGPVQDEARLRRSIELEAL
ncbi:MAG: insulinase family protein [Verrucomicrobia bacterium]|nr:insulinase family protein [Verrucomicrobiota bacterium]